MIRETKSTTKFVLSEQDITVSKQQMLTENLAVSTQMRSGGHWNSCQTEACCDQTSGGQWKDIGCWIPIDQGTGDWD